MRGLVAESPLDALGQLVYGLGLVARGLVGRDYAEGLARALAPKAHQLAAHALRLPGHALVCHRSSLSPR